MIQQVQNSCQFHGLPGDDANKHLDKFLHVTQSIKVNGVTDDALRLYIFPHSLTHHDIAWFDRLSRNSNNTFEQMAKMFLEKYFPPSMVTKLRNEIINFRQRPDESLFEAWECYKRSIDRCPNHNMLPVTQIDTFYNGLTLRLRDTINAAALLLARLRTYMLREPIKFMKINTASSSGSGTLSGNTITNPKEDLKDFDTNPRVPLILEKSFLKTERALIDVFEGELTLRVGTFNLDQTSRYSTNYNDMTANRIDVIDMACEEYSQEVLGFFDVIVSGNPTPYYDLIVSTTSPTLTPFENSDFLLEEDDAFLALEDDLTSPEVNQSYVDTEGDILLLEAFLNDDPSLPPPN
nr:reverse transcriptase domain-containing protein [Tanacetum cinerariifolium]